MESVLRRAHAPPRTTLRATLARPFRRVLPRLRATLDALAHSLWLVPFTGIALAIGLSILLHAIDERLSPDATAWYLFRGGPEGARSVLAAVASSIMTFTGVVFSVTVLVLQLATQQFSPRVLRTLLGDRTTQVSLALFVGTFLYALLTLRTVRGASDGVREFVPSLSVWFAVALASACVVTFVYFIHHVAQSIRAVNVLARIADETRAALERLYPEGIGDGVELPGASRPAGEPALLVTHRGRSGVLVAVADDAITEVASASSLTVVLRPMLGDFVPHGAVLFELWGDVSRFDGGALADALVVGRERTVHQDPAFGFRGIVDVAERALSPGINDPTTAVQAIDELHDLLRRLSTRRIPSPVRESGRGIVVLPRPDFDAYVRLALDEIRYCGAGSVQVLRRLRSLLDDLLATVPAERRGELERQLTLLQSTAARHAAELTTDPALLRRGSPQGHGP